MASSLASSSRFMLGRSATSAVWRITPIAASRALSTTTAAPESASKQMPPQESAVGQLTWPEYLKMRRSRRLAGMVTSLPTTLLAAVGSGSYFLTQDLDPTNLVAGIDPVYVSIAAVLGCTGAGWLIGPSVGSFFWSLMHSNKMPAYRAKDAEFYSHIKRNRVDPSRQSMQNPVGDWHGERIGSIKQYRQWLRDQQVYRRKASHGLKEDI